MSNRCLSLLMGGLLCLGLTACGGSQSASQTTSDDLLVGDWTPAGIEISHSVYSFEDVPQLGDLYDSNHLTVLEDGTFVYMNMAIFVTKGGWTSSWMEGYDHTYTLKHETGYRSSFENGELVRVDEGPRDGEFRVWLTNEDTDTLVFSDPDSDQLIYYTRDDGDPFYLDVYNTSVPGNATQDTTEEEPPETSEMPDPQPSTENVTIGMRNALATAHDYLDSTAFSYSGLIDQLEYEGYTYAEAVYAVDNCGADWYEQAALMAAEYLDTMSFSRTGLIDQLEYEGFSYDQAVYGVEQAGY